MPPTMTTKLEAPVPRWRQIANILREAILDGDYPPGQPLPSELVLSGQFGVSRPTVRQGIAMLRDEGLLTIRRPYGTIVRDPHARPDIVEHRALTLTADSYAEPGEQFTDIGPPVHIRVDATITLAAMLHVQPGEPLATREVLQQADRGARRAIRLYLPFRVAAEADTPWADNAQLPQPVQLYSWFAQHHGPLKFRESVRARMPVGDETQALHTQPGVPLLVITRLAETDRPVSLEEIHMPADMIEVSYPLPVTRRAAKTTSGRPG
jgi:GntR family transcriptional regulator